MPFTDNILLHACQFFWRKFFTPPSCKFMMHLIIARATSCNANYSGSTIRDCNLMVETANLQATMIVYSKTVIVLKILHVLICMDLHRDISNT